MSQRSFSNYGRGLKTITYIQFIIEPKHSGDTKKIIYSFTFFIIHLLLSTSLFDDALTISVGKCTNK